MTITETIARAIREYAQSDGQPLAKTIICNRDDKIATAAITALTEAGYAIVPRDPSEEMVEVGYCIHDFDGSLNDLADDNNRRNAAAIYRAMINATPNPIIPPIQNTGEVGEGE